MSNQYQKYVEDVTSEIQKEFPNDPALQQIHIARKILTKQAEEKGMSFIDYIRIEARFLKDKKTTINTSTL